MKGLERALLVAALAVGGCGDDSEGRTAVGGAVAGNPSVPQGPDPFDDRVLTTYRIEMDPADWDAIVADPHDNTWRRCSVEWEGEFYPEVAIRPAGNRSRIPGNPKPSVRLEFDEFLRDREFHKFSTLKMDSMIHDATMMKARLEYALYRARGVPAPRYVHARFYVNGIYIGLYGVEERVGKEFVRKNFGRPVNQLYRWAASSTSPDMRWGGLEPMRQYVPGMWIPEIDELPSGDEAIREFCWRLNNDLERLPEIFDVERFLSLLAVETLLGEGDQLVAGQDGTRSANIHLYKDPGSGKYVILPWDCDQGFWRTQTGITYAFENRILARNLVLWNPANFERYKDLLRTLLAGPHETSRVHARVDYILEQIRDAAYEDTGKMYTNEKFLTRVNELKNYVAIRNASFAAQLGSP